MGTRQDQGPTPEPREAVDLDTLLEDLRSGLAAGGEQPQAGRLLGLPELDGNDVWVDIAGAAAVADVEPKTITGWLSRHQPKTLPFPAPQRILYRNYWPLSVVTAWRKAYTAAKR